MQDIIGLQDLRACFVMKGRRMTKAMAACSQAILAGRRGGGTLKNVGDIMGLSGDIWGISEGYHGDISKQY